MDTLRLSCSHYVQRVDTLGVSCAHYICTVCRHTGALLFTLCVYSVWTHWGSPVHTTYVQRVDTLGLSCSHYVCTVCGHTGALLCTLRMYSVWTHWGSPVHMMYSVWTHWGSPVSITLLTLLLTCTTVIIEGVSRMYSTIAVLLVYE